MKTIELTQGRLVLVDDEDFKWLTQWSWCYQHDKNTGYAKRTDRSHQQQRTIRMHVALMKRHKRWRRGEEVDHINTCGCDNRKINLRLTTRDKQTINAGLKSNNTSGVTGVGWYKPYSKWRARITINGKLTHLGYFDNFNEAVKERQKAEYKYFGEFRHDPTNVCPLGYTGECPDCAARLKGLQCKSISTH